MENYTLDKNKKFKFKCKKCGFCCNFTITLYPFDIMNICKLLNINSREFLKKYAIPQIDEDGILRCILKKDGKCIFNKDNLCTIHSARPLRCRIFPIGRYFKEDKVYYLFPTQKCTGFDSNKRQSIQEWLDEQGASEYEEQANKWNQFIIKLKNGNYLIKDPKFLTIFTKIFYDFDNELVSNYKKEMDIQNIGEHMKLLYSIAEETLLKM